MAVQVPTSDQLWEVAEEIGLNLTEDDINSFIELMRPNVDAYNIIDAMPDNLPKTNYARSPGYRPSGDENKYNAC